ncbi:hypothetical protein [Pyrodictium abyssi]|uniref:Uncharacterized protein n=1 Tax=Pyrodictium abyssi TaxID=54256 RepID=A0ABM8J077_9CREN|nr:hypothetical protein PABY_24030 [Pyrodictium abyssi]
MEIERGEAAAELATEALSYVSEACRSPRLRSVCERLEDVLVAALDEAREIELAPYVPRPPVAIEAAARELEQAAREAEKMGLGEEASLLWEAARRLSMLARIA